MVAGFSLLLKRRSQVATNAAVKAEAIAAATPIFQPTPPGCAINSTPVKPATTANQRLIPMVSPRMKMDKTDMKIGAA